MKSTFRVEIDYDNDNQPILEVVLEDSTNDLRDKFAAQLFKDTVYFEIEKTKEPPHIKGFHDDNQTRYTLRPVKRKQLYIPNAEEISNSYLPLWPYTGTYPQYKGVYLNHPEKEDTMLNLNKFGTQVLQDELWNSLRVNIQDAVNEENKKY